MLPERRLGLTATRRLQDSDETQDVAAGQTEDVQCTRIWARGLLRGPLGFIPPIADISRADASHGSPPAAAP